MTMGVNIPGLFSIIVFYILILLVGIWAARKRNKSKNASDTDEVMIAGRNIGLFIGIFTLTATWVGGGYINGTAESIYNDGLYWCQAPFGYSISLILSGLIFAKKMREKEYKTMLDPFEELFGAVWGAFLFIPPLLGEIFWSAAILSALGSTITVILDISNIPSIIVSACIAVTYTLFGGLYSVAYTDVIQLVCIFVGLWLSIPFAINSPAVGEISPDVTNWLGTPDTQSIGIYIDYFLLLIFGGIPWQVYFQRVLASKTPKIARIVSIFGGLGCLLMSIPPILIGIIAKGTDWRLTKYTGSIMNDTGSIPVDDSKLILPLVLQYLTPPVVSLLGLGAVSAAVMSSADSSVLSVASMFSQNVYRPLLRRKASQRELIWVMRFAIVVAAVLATYMAIVVNSIYGLWYLCSDLVYVILFPQLVQAVHLPTYTNTYGSILSYFLAAFLRLGGGEELLGIPDFIKYPFYKDGVQYFPFRTFAMIIGFISLRLGSSLAYHIFTSGCIPRQYDILRCFTNVGKAPVVATEMKWNSSSLGEVNVAYKEKE